MKSIQIYILLFLYIHMPINLSAFIPRSGITVFGNAAKGFHFNYSPKIPNSLPENSPSVDASLLKKFDILKEVCKKIPFNSLSQQVEGMNMRDALTTANDIYESGALSQKSIDYEKPGLAYKQIPPSQELVEKLKMVCPVVQKNSTDKFMDTIPISDIINAQKNQNNFSQNIEHEERLVEYNVNAQEELPIDISEKIIEPVALEKNNNDITEKNNSSNAKLDEMLEDGLDALMENKKQKEIEDKVHKSYDIIPEFPSVIQKVVPQKEATQKVPDNMQEKQKIVLQELSPIEKQEAVTLDINELGVKEKETIIQAQQALQETIEQEQVLLKQLQKDKDQLQKIQGQIEKNALNKQQQDVLSDVQKNDKQMQDSDPKNTSQAEKMEDNSQPIIQATQPSLSISIGNKKIPQDIPSISANKKILDTVQTKDAVVNEIVENNSQPVVQTTQPSLSISIGNKKIPQNIPSISGNKKVLDTTIQTKDTLVNEVVENNSQPVVQTIQPSLPVNTSNKQALQNPASADSFVSLPKQPLQELPNKKSVLQDGALPIDKIPVATVIQEPLLPSVGNKVSIASYQDIKAKLNFGDGSSYDRKGVTDVAEQHLPQEITSVPVPQTGNKNMVQQEPVGNTDKQQHLYQTNKDDIIAKNSMQPDYPVQKKQNEYNKSTTVDEKNNAITSENGINADEQVKESSSILENKLNKITATDTAQKNSNKATRDYSQVKTPVFVPKNNRVPKPFIPLKQPTGIPNNAYKESSTIPRSSYKPTIISPTPNNSYDGVENVQPTTVSFEKEYQYPVNNSYDNDDSYYTQPLDPKDYQNYGALVVPDSFGKPFTQVPTSSNSVESLPVARVSVLPEQDSNIHTVMPTPSIDAIRNDSVQKVLPAPSNTLQPNAVQTKPKKIPEKTSQTTRFSDKKLPIHNVHITPEWLQYTIASLLLVATLINIAGLIWWFLR